MHRSFFLLLLLLCCIIFFSFIIIIIAVAAIIILYICANNNNAFRMRSSFWTLIKFTSFETPLPTILCIHRPQFVLRMIREENKIQANQCASDKSKYPHWMLNFCFYLCKWKMHHYRFSTFLSCVRDWASAHIISIVIAQSTIIYIFCCCCCLPLLLLLLEKCIGASNKLWLVSIDMEKC